MRRIGDYLRMADGWRRLAFAFAAGAGSALAFAPLNFFPALLAGYAALVLLLDGAAAAPRPLRRAALTGWAFAFGQFLIGLHWIGYPFMVDPSAHLWQMPFAILLLPAGLGLFGALACAAAMYFWREGAGRIFVLAICWSICEWLRGHILTGFPWNLSAYGWGASFGILQSTAVIGAYGLGFLTILLGASFAEVFVSRWRLPALLTALFALFWLGGDLRLSAEKVAFVPGVQLRIVQPDIAQREKDSRDFMLRNWERLLDLTTRAPLKGITQIVWPEDAPPFLLQASPTALEEIAALTADKRSLITGAQRLTRNGDDIAAYNSLYIFRPGGRTPYIYDKFHLVPFGEYLPFAKALHAIGVTKLTAGEIGFSAGDGPHTYSDIGAPPVGPLICYEIIFPGAVTAKQRPGWLVNVTNDAWFGPWAGPRQHFLIARVRAIEEGLPVIRAANTGISAVIDPKGRILAMIGLNRMGFLDAGLPAALPATPYARFGDAGFFLLLILGVIIAQERKWRRK
ncbi:MAG TPA: apolipoprotein N-acyltransferase [Rhizomicrobium sp.]